MELTLHCPACSCGFCEYAEDILEELNPGDIYAMGDGETLEDRLYATLGTGSELVCPACGGDVAIDEETLGRLAMCMLTSS